MFHSFCDIFKRKIKKLKIFYTWYFNLSWFKHSTDIREYVCNEIEMFFFKLCNLLFCRLTSHEYIIYRVQHLLNEKMFNALVVSLYFSLLMAGPWIYKILSQNRTYKLEIITLFFWNARSARGSLRWQTAVYIRAPPQVYCQRGRHRSTGVDVREERVARERPTQRQIQTYRSLVLLGLFVVERDSGNNDDTHRFGSCARVHYHPSLSLSPLHCKSNVNNISRFFLAFFN